MKLKINNCIFTIGLLLSLYNYKYLYIIFSTFIGVVLVNLEKNNKVIPIHLVQYFVFGFTIGSIFSYMFEIIIGLVFGYIISNYGVSNQYILNNYNYFKEYCNKYSIKVENGYIIKDNKEE
mgnify:FL=1|tara:strand:+ start:1389 stop:1751 length:363 start_codon:yes stop_codon:yes gene_type:complete